VPVGFDRIHAISYDWIKLRGIANTNGLRLMAASPSGFFAWNTRIIPLHVLSGAACAMPDHAPK
jgi:hypothetical protein